METPLSVKHQTFVDFYFSNGRNAYQAYRAAYPNCKERSARTKSGDLLKKVAKSGYFASKSSEYEKQDEIKHGVTRDWLIQQHLDLLKDAMLGDEIPTRDGGFYIKKDRATASKALDQLTKITGDYAETKVKLNMGGQDAAGSPDDILKVKLQ